MGEPIISCACPAIRSFRYKACYDSLSKGVNFPFEVIFVGDKSPEEKMPKNFHYIYTEVKPAQCYEIAARNARGHLLHFIGDDLTFDEGYLNKLYRYSLILDMDKVLISNRLRLMVAPPRFKMIDKGCIFDSWIPNAPFIGVSPLFRKDLWHKLGGIDKRFYGTFSDIDMQMRFYEYGMSPFLAPDVINQENNFYDVETKEDSLIARTGNESWALLASLWVKEDGSVSDKRLSSVFSFKDDNLLAKNQEKDII